MPLPSRAICQSPELKRAAPLCKGDLWAGPGLLLQKVLWDLPAQGALARPLVDHLEQGLQPWLLPQLGHQLGPQKGFQSSDKILVSKTAEVWEGGKLDGGPVQLLKIQNVQEKLERCPGEVPHMDFRQLQTPKELGLQRRWHSKSFRCIDYLEGVTAVGKPEWVSSQLLVVREEEVNVLVGFSPKSQHVVLESKTQ